MIRGLDREALEKAAGLPRKEIDRFLRTQRLYLETSAFNYFVDNFDLPDIELTRAFQRRKGVIFVTSPMLLWEIMLNTDRERADTMLLAAQALFDPLLLATPTELTTRYLRHTYPENAVNYSFFTNVAWRDLWRAMTTDFTRTFSFDFDSLLAKTKPFRIISKNLGSVIEGRYHDDEIVILASTYVNDVHTTLCDDLRSRGVDDHIAKFVILYVFLLLLISADLDGSEAYEFWADKGFTEKLEPDQIIRVFTDFPEIFVCGPILEMAVMAALQYRSGSTNRGSLHDGMHMAYAPYVDAILSNDDAFLKLSAEHSFYRHRVLHLSEVQFSKVELPLADYPDDQRLRFR